MADSCSRRFYITWSCCLLVVGNGIMTSGMKTVAVVPTGQIDDLLDDEGAIHPLGHRGVLMRSEHHLDRDYIVGESGEVYRQGVEVDSERDQVAVTQSTWKKTGTSTINTTNTTATATAVRNGTATSNGASPGTGAGTAAGNGTRATAAAGSNTTGTRTAAGNATGKAAGTATGKAAGNAAGNATGNATASAAGNAGATAQKGGASGKPTAGNATSKQPNVTGGKATSNASASASNTSSPNRTTAGAGEGGAGTAAEPKPTKKMVQIKVTMQGLDFDKVDRKPAAKTELVDTIKDSFLASMFGYRKSDLRVFLTKGSIVADVEITPKDGSNSTALKQVVATKKGALQDDVSNKVKAMDDVKDLLEPGKTVADITTTAEDPVEVTARASRSGVVRQSTDTKTVSHSDTHSRKSHSSSYQEHHHNKTNTTTISDTDIRNEFGMMNPLLGGRQMKDHAADSMPRGSSSKLGDGITAE